MIARAWVARLPVVLHSSAMRRIGRRPFLLSTLVVAACAGKAVIDGVGDVEGDPPPSPSLPAPSPTFPDASPADPATPPKAECVDRVPQAPIRSLHGTSSNGPYPTRLYSWTTEAQVAGLRAGTPLFSKTTTDSGHRGLLFAVLEARAKAGDPAAALLAGPMFATGRFAWPFLIGARVSPERYGDSIVAFTLKPEALFARFNARGGGVTFVDAEGKSVASAVALANPGRIGAFFFVNDLNTSQGTAGYSCLGGTLGPGILYREFYLGNLAMIEEWSVGTEGIATRLVDEMADLHALAADLDCTAGRIGPNCDRVLGKWAREATSRADKLVNSLAFASAFGKVGLTPADLKRMADDLGTIDRTVNPLVVRP
jgi:uncharacterized membrane protein